MHAKNSIHILANHNQKYIIMTKLGLSQESMVGIASENQFNLLYN